MEFIVTFLIILVAVMWLSGKILPRLLAWWLKRKMNAAGGGFDPFVRFGGSAAPDGGSPSGTPGREGTVTVRQMEETEKRIEKDMGEYIDFEEEA